MTQETTEQILTREGMLPFIDVSRYQGRVDYDIVRELGIIAAVAKATEGERHVDPQFYRNAACAPRNAVWCGSYHYFRPEQDPIAQARHFAEVAAECSDLLPVLDFETLRGVSPELAVARALDFIKATRELWGVPRVIVYSYPYFLAELVTSLGAGPLSHLAVSTELWIAHYKDRMGEPWIPAGTPWPSWTAWQWDGDGGLKLPHTDCDFNWFKGDRTDFALRWVRATNPSTAERLAAHE